MKYKLQITRDDDHVLHEREMTADEVIDVLAFKPTSPTEVSGPNEMKVDSENITEVVDEARENIDTAHKSRFAPPPPSDMEKARNNLAIKEAQAKSGKVCGECGQPGHNKRTCPTLRTDQPSKAIATDDPDWYYQDILDMLRDGVSEEEVYNTVTTSVTDNQYQEALEWAKEQLD